MSTYKDGSLKALVVMTVTGGFEESTRDDKKWDTLSGKHLADGSWLCTEASSFSFHIIQILYCISI